MSIHVFVAQLFQCFDLILDLCRGIVLLNCHSDYHFKELVPHKHILGNKRPTHIGVHRDEQAISICLLEGSHVEHVDLVQEVVALVEWHGEDPANDA
jgi:hypothetical protein